MNHHRSLVCLLLVVGCSSGGGEGTPRGSGAAAGSSTGASGGNRGGAGSAGMGSAGSQGTGGIGGGAGNSGGSSGTAGGASGAVGGLGGVGSASGGAPGGGPPSTWVDEVPVPTPPPIADNQVVFDPPGGTFAGSQLVKLSARAPGAVIHFTPDGSLPTRASAVYRTPVMLAETAILRALVAGTGAAAAGDGPVSAAAYVRLTDDVRGFTSNLPIILLHTHRSGVLQLLAAPLVPGSASVFEPSAQGRATLLGPATLSMRAGVRIRGNSSRAFPQRSYAFELREPGAEPGPNDDTARVVARLPADSDFALVAPSYIDRSLVRTAVGFTLSNDAGQYAPRVRMVEVFLTESGGATGMRDYLGVFTLTEKIKRGKDRVNVQKLDPAATSGPGITGGYIFRIDHEQRHFTAGGTFFGFVYPEWEELQLPSRAPQVGYLTGHMQEFFEAIARPDFKHPRTGKHYGEYIDVPSFIDNNLLNALLKNVDAFRFSTYFYKDRERPVKAGPLWDIDRSAGTTHDDGGRTVNPEEWARGDAAHPLTYGWWGRLFADPSFKTAHARRWDELTRGPLSVARIHATVDRFAAVVTEAEKRHNARWPVMPPMGGAHAEEIRLLKVWFAARVAWMSAQLLPGTR